MNRTILRAAALFLALYAAALVPRLMGVTAAAPQVDEIHWRDRAYRVLHAFKDGNYASFSNHLAHPGVPTALIMAVGQGAAEKYNRFFGLEHGGPRYLDALGASRVANAFFSALIAPLYFVFAAAVFGWQAALITAAFLAFDVQLVAVGRMAHLDAATAVFALCSVFCYGFAVARRSVPLKLAAGFFFGFCLATKPNAAALIPAFLLFKLARLGIFSKSRDQGERTLFTWSDAAAVAVGHAVLVALFTRFWRLDKRYWREMSVRSEFADALYDTGLWLQAHWPLALMAVAAFAGTGLLLRARLSAKGFPALALHASAVCFCCAVLAAVELLLPQAVDHLIRLYLRTFVLADMPHISHGWAWPRPPLGYAGLLFGKLPLLSLCCMLLGLAAAGIRFRSLRDHAPLALHFLLLFFCTALLWTGVLSVSSKEAIRYLLPIFFALYAFAGFGVFELANSILRRLPTLRQKRLFSAPAAAFCISLYGIFTLARAHPDYLLFSNSLSGGLREATERGYPLATAGFNESLRFIHQKAAASGRKPEVVLLTDRDAALGTYRRLYPEAERRLSFRDLPLVFAGEYVLVSNSLLPMFRAYHNVRLDTLVPLYSYDVAGTAVTTVFEVPWQRFEQPYEKRVAASFTRTGEKARADDVLIPGRQQPGRVLVADSARHSRGYLFFGDDLRIAAGRYELQLLAALPRGAALGALPGETEALRLEMTGACVRRIKQHELEPGLLRPVAAECTVRSDAKVQVRAYWEAASPLVVERFIVRRLGEIAPESR